MTILPNSARELVNSGAVAHVVTLNEDGSAQVSGVWIATVGDELVIMHGAEHVKVRNLRRDPRVEVSIESEERSKGGTHPPFQFHLVLYGTATIIEEAAPDVAPLIRANYGSPRPRTCREATSLESLLTGSAVSAPGSRSGVSTQE